MYTKKLDEEMSWLEEQLNDFVFSEPNFSRDAVSEIYGKEVAESFRRQFMEPSKQEATLRVSSLGKPAVLQALTVLGVDNFSVLTTKLRHVFHTGDVFEAYLKAYMKLCKYAVLDEQAEVNFKGVLGHIDLAVETPSGKVVLEVKTMSQNYFYNFIREQDDARGYLTQAAVYSHCMSLPIYWVCLNKGTHEIKVIKPDVESFDKVLERAERLIPKLRAISSLEDLVDTLQCPPVEQEVFRRKETGNFLVPASMRYSPFRHCWYEIETTQDGKKPKEYVLDYLPKDEVLKRLRRMTEVSATVEVEELLKEEGA